MTERTPLPTSRPARYTQASRQPAVDGPNTSRKEPGKQAHRLDTGHLSLFAPAAAKRVQELLGKIAYLNQATNDAKRWFEEEDELLEVLRQQSLPYRHIAEVYLTRHSYNACESCASRLRRGEWEGA
ncbi:hypothetical protein N658DRAFT_499202 [Parathielavia hyrcaniae]|uniref:Uncharacterized protein n=1 Tax=Parathielavia hyrcaniae TaxID=113614 RepID=A0AAN6Q0H8_9PEZI|nr:hypothetical protein N658DRAFT_499202 [Parathielavia hyrcaniae]